VTILKNISALRIAKVALALPFFAALGAFVLVRWAWNLQRRARWGARLLGESIPCPYCACAVPLTGRFECGSPGCGAIFLGFIQRCEICGSGCLWTPCPRCQASVQVGMRR
jgi:hypothetical protein